MDYFEKRVDGEVKYKGVIVTVRLDRAELHTGRIVRREVVEHPGGVTILPIDGDGNCYLVRQFRYPFGKMLLEAPAGKLEPGEEPRASAVRELSEETGFTADELVYMGPERGKIQSQGTVGHGDARRDRRRQDHHRRAEGGEIPEGTRKSGKKQMIAK